MLHRVSASADDIHQQLQLIPLFKGISEDVLYKLAASCHRVTFAANAHVFQEGNNLLYCPLIEKGQIEVFRTSYDGDEKIFGLFSVGQIIALAAVFMPHGRYPMTARAKTNGQAILISCQAIKAMVFDNSVLCQRLLQQFSQKIYDNVNKIDWLTSSTAAERLAAYLSKLQRTQNTLQFDIPLSRAQLAAILGIRSETLSRLLAHWQRQKIINFSGKRINIIDLNYLNALAFAAVRPF